LTPTALPVDPQAEQQPRLLDAVIGRHRRAWESGLLAAMFAGCALVLAGTAAASLDLVQAQRPSILMVAAGMLLLGVASAMSYPLADLRAVGRKTTGGTRYDQLRYWTRFKTSALLLNLLTAVGALLLLASLMHRLDQVELRTSFVVVFRLTSLATAILVVNQLATHYLSLRVHLEQERAEGFEGLSFLLALAGSSGFALLAMVVAFQDAGQRFLLFRDTDAPFLLLAGAVFGSVALYVGRRLPSIVGLYTEEYRYYGGQRYLSRRKAVLMPAMMALALLFLVVLLVLVGGLGLVGLVEEIPRNTVLIGVFAIIMVAMVTSVAMSLLLSKSDDKPALFRLRRSAEAKRALAILGSSAVVAVALLLVSLKLALGASLLGMGPDRWPDFLALAFLAALGPYGFTVAERNRRIRRLEERFPDFLRDIAASRKAGLTMPDAVRIASKGEYGALTPEIVKMADQLSWDVPFEEALHRFGERVKTPLVLRAVSLINEASRSGGNVTDVLMAAARDAREIKNLERERMGTVGLYTSIVYLTFLVFLAVVAVLYGSFMPEILKTTHAAQLKGASGFGGLSFGTISLGEFRVFYFLAAIVQGLGNGLVAGMMGSGKALDGLRHSFLMVAIALVVFAAVIQVPS